MRENEPVLHVLSVCAREIILEKGGILSEKRYSHQVFSKVQPKGRASKPI